MLRLCPKNSFDCDVIVGGGGPAGTSAAIRLADSGYDVILIDSQHFPRDKVCGDFVGPAGLLELADLGIATLPEYRASNVIRGAALFLNGDLLIEQPFPEIEGLPNCGLVVPRLILDNWLWQAARTRGARTLEGHKITSYACDRDGMTVTLAGETRSLRARLLLAADGSASTIARQLTGNKPDRRDRIVAVRAYYEDVRGPMDRCDLLFSGDSFPGYYWLFPTGPGTANVGLGMMLETLPPSNARLADLLADLIAQDPAWRSRLQGARQVGATVGWPLMTYNRSRPVVADRLMLLGDAAGLINPINGEGIQYALESGRWAAEAAAKALAADRLDVAGLAPYEATLRARMNYDMALAGLIVTVIRNRRLNGLWLAALRIMCARARRDPAYARLAGGILAGVVPAKDAVSLRMILGTLEQAAVSLGFGTLSAVIGSPRGASAAGISIARGAVSLVGASAENPRAFTRWGAEVAGSSLHLAGEIGGNLLARARARL